MSFPNPRGRARLDEEIARLMGVLASQGRLDPNARYLQAVVDPELEERAMCLAQSGAAVNPEMRAAIIRGELEERESVRVVAEWLADKQALRMLVLAGPKRCGKTVAASNACARHRGVSVHATALQELLHKLQGGWGKERAALDRLEGCALLAIEDLGTEKFPDSMAVALRVFLDCRLDKRTIITTNLGAAAFKTRYATDNGRLLGLLQDSADWRALSNHMRSAPTKGEQ